MPDGYAVDIARLEAVITGGFSSLNGNLDRLGREVHEIRGEIGQLRTSVTRLEQTTDKHDESVERLVTRVDRLEARHNELEKMVVKWVSIAGVVSIVVGWGGNALIGQLIKGAITGSP